MENNCFRLLTEHKRFLRYPNKEDDVYERFRNEFLEYLEENYDIKDIYDED